MKRIQITFFLILSCAASFSAFSGPSESFSFPKGLEDEIRFWRTVFGTYGDNQVVFYDERFLNVIYEVNDFSGLDARQDLTPQVKQNIRQKEIRRTMHRIAASLKRLARGIPEAVGRPALAGAIVPTEVGHPSNELTDEERYYQKLFDGIDDPDRFLKASNRIQAQPGQKDRLQKAIAKSVAWMGDIESIFEKNGVPKELTALMFIESMFNPLAISNVGASGLWQFMPETGRSYVSINNFWDDRNDILNASAGAARFLKNLYSQTGDWALAINSYHSGLGRILKAVKTLETKEIAVIIHHFQDPAYAFYSRNYVPEFYAMVSLLKNKDAYFGSISEKDDRQYDIVQTSDFIILPKIATRFGIRMDVLRKLNTALKEEVLNGDLPLPPHYPLRVPKGTGYYLATSFGVRLR
jgi:membrane-bound lytic murein transglycosylase D